MNWKFWTWFSRKAAIAEKRKTFAGDGSWPFYVSIEGDDAVLIPIQGRKMLATWFGGDNDPNDSGNTASGIKTKGNPSLIGCALPMSYIAACAGSPIPKLPWNTLVTVSGRNHWDNEPKALTVPLIDIGPNKRTGKTIDLTLAAFTKFAPLRQGVFQAETIRIHGGAKHFT